jgi:hypothetical protein
MAHKIKLLKIIPQKNKVLQRSDLCLGHKKRKRKRKRKGKKNPSMKSLPRSVSKQVN